MQRGTRASRSDTDLSVMGRLLRDAEARGVSLWPSALAAALSRAADEHEVRYRAYEAALRSHGLAAIGRIDDPRG